MTVVMMSPDRECMLDWKAEDKAGRPNGAAGLAIRVWESILEGKAEYFITRESACSASVSGAETVSFAQSVSQIGPAGKPWAQITDFRFLMLR